MDKSLNLLHKRTVRAFVLSDGDQQDDDLVRVLTSIGCEIIHRWSPQQALDGLLRSQPDLVVLSNTTPGSANIGVIQHLRSSGDIEHSVPTVAVLRDSVTVEQQLAMLRAGIWDIMAHPLNGAAFEARLRNFLSARLTHLESKEAALLDEVTGLYTRRGLETRVTELGAHCARQGTTLSCVAFRLSAADSVTQSLHLESSLLASVAAELRRVGRTSDTIGRAEDCDFVVLAAGVNGGNARLLANRLTRSVTALLGSHGIECDAPWVGRVLQPNRNGGRLGEELLSDTLLALREVTAEHEVAIS